MVIKSLYLSVEKAFSESLFITKTAHELLWGYQDDLLEFVSNITFLSSLGLPLPPGGKFGLQVIVNGVTAILNAHLPLQYQYQDIKEKL